MKPKKPTNRQIAHAFRTARQYLWDGHDKRKVDEIPNICGALGRAYDNGEISYDLDDAAEAVISRRLSSCCTVVIWLIHHGFITPNYNHKDVQEYRHRWLDALIREFSK